ncbi:MAG TPA: glycosyltransferase family 9 protein [Verrucomicrobiae bacterium]
MKNFLRKFLNLRTAHSRAEKISSILLPLQLLLLRIACWFKRRELVIIVLVEHFGDIVACEPVARYLKQNNPDCFLVWICRKPFVELIAYNPHVDRVIIVSCLNPWLRIRSLRIGHRQIDLHFNGRGCAICRRPIQNCNGDSNINIKNYFEIGGLLKSFSLGAGLPALDETPQLYFPTGLEEKIQALHLPEKYLVFHCKANESTRDWLEENWRQLQRLVFEEYGLPIIEVGLDSVLQGSQNNDGVINLCGKLNLLESALVIQQARLFVGIDSGPAHFANAVQCPGVILLGHYRGFQNYVPYSGYYASDGAMLVRAENITQLRISSVLNAIDQQMDIKSLFRDRKRSGNI